MTQIDDQTADRIDQLAEEGNALLETEGDWRGALACWSRALDLVPEPKTRAEEATWLYASMGEAHLAGGEHDAALGAFETAYRCPDGHLNPFVLLRLGQQLRLRDQTDAAAKHLLRAYMLEGDALFDGAEDDLAFLRSRPEFAAGRA